MRLAPVIKFVGLFLMLAWLAAAALGIGPIAVRPLLLFTGALISWWVVRASEN